MVVAYIIAGFGAEGLTKSEKSWCCKRAGGKEETSTFSAVPLCRVRLPVGRSHFRLVVGKDFGTRSRVAFPIPDLDRCKRRGIVPVKLHIVDREETLSHDAIGYGNIFDFVSPY